MEMGLVSAIYGNRRKYEQTILPVKLNLELFAFMLNHFDYFSRLILKQDHLASLIISTGNILIVFLTDYKRFRFFGCFIHAIPILYH